MARPMQWCFLGLVDYREALRLQLRLREEIHSGERADTLLLLEHPPVITLGRSADALHVIASPADLEQRAIDCVHIERGGEVTYHGPGQLVGYPIRRVGRAVRVHIRGMVDALLGYLTELGIRGEWQEDAPGIWTDRGKIAAVGVDARGGVAMHGFALNVNPDLSAFDLIVPCGSTRPVTSINALLGIAPAVASTAAPVARCLAARYGRELVEVTAADLLAPLDEGLR